MALAANQTDFTVAVIAFPRAASSSYWEPVILHYERHVQFHFKIRHIRGHQNRTASVAVN